MSYQIVQDADIYQADVQVFIERLNRLSESDTVAARDLFDAEQDLFVSRAPGRLDVMGGIADYSGSLVLQLPIAESTRVALQPRTDRRMRIVSISGEADDRLPLFDMVLDDLVAGTGVPISYDAARALFQTQASTAWAAYVAGVFLVLMRERGVKFSNGANILVESDIPEGKGVSSSAAIEVATLQALSAAFDIKLEPREVAVLCQTVENQVVGAPCGVMDQMTSACGHADQLLALLCQPAELQPSVEIPENVRFWGLDSGVRHSVSGADYGSVRIGAFMGYRIIAEHAGFAVTPGEHPGDPVSIDDPIWHGYLANVTPSLFNQRFGGTVPETAIPETLSGEEFIAAHTGTSDRVTRPRPDKTYAVRRPAAHPVFEHHRVQAFRELLHRSGEESGMTLLGELMYQSHASYSACGLGSAGTDRLVELVREAGPSKGLYGAKITGGGSGGTVAVLGRPDAEAAVQEVAQRYADERDHTPYLFTGSSPGAVAFGCLRLSQSA
jgi:L-arabinokinase